MPATKATTFCNMEPVQRPIGTIRSHRIEGTTPQFLENAVELKLDCERSDSLLHVNVKIINSQTGHHVPTGVTVRSMILLIEAEAADSKEQLVFIEGDTIHALGAV